MTKVKEESEKAGLKFNIEKAGLKFNIQKTKIMSFGSWQIMGKKWKQWQILFSWAPKSLW